MKNLKEEQTEAATRRCKQRLPAAKKIAMDVAIVADNSGVEEMSMLKHCQEKALEDFVGGVSLQSLLATRS